MNYWTALFCIIILFACNTTKNDFEPARYVNPFIGTGQVENYIDAGNTYPGAVRPWGMVSMNPHNLDFRDMVESTTYRKGMPYIYGFGHTHVSGMGCNASGAILLKATSGPMDVSVDHTRSEYSNETAIPGYYAVTLDRFNIGAEFTTTERSGISRFKFPKGKANLMIDLGLTPDFGKSGRFEFTSDSTFQGYKTEGSVCDCGMWGKVHFYGTISKKATSRGVFQNWELVGSSSHYIEGEFVGAFATFEVDQDEVIEVRVGVSYVSSENARINLQAESIGRSFEEIRKESYAIWNAELSKIYVEGESEDNKIKFYTALYHSLLHPNVFSDVNGDYRMHNSNTIANSPEVRYVNFSMWDTYRTVHPLLSLVYPERQEAMISSLLQMYRESGWLPRLEVLGNNTGVMVGDPASIIINDTYQRGITNFDTNTALEAMTKSATFVSGQNMNRRGFRQYMQYGFIPHDKPGNDSVFGWFNDLAWGTVSTALEFALADWNISTFARSMGNNELADKLLDQSRFYKNSYNPGSGFFQARYSSGSWYEPFDPLEHFNTIFNRHMRGGPGYVEGSAWNYLFFVHHDIKGLIELMGGKEIFVSRLQQLFDEDHYDATNEPNIAFPFLFNYVKGEEWRSQKIVQELIETKYTADEFGIPGNDDTGTLSAWLVFAMMGIFPDCPGSPDFQIVKSSFDKVVIKLNRDFYKGKQFVIRTNHRDNASSFIETMWLRGSSYPSFSISHSEITNGGDLRILTGSK